MKVMNPYNRQGSKTSCRWVGNMGPTGTGVIRIDFDYSGARSGL